MFFSFTCWLCWVFTAVCLSLVVCCMDLSLQWLLSLLSTGSRAPGPQCSVAHGLSCPTACGIFPDQELNPCALHRAGSHSLYHQGSPNATYSLWRMSFPKHQSFFPSALSILLSNNKNKHLGSIVFVLSTWLSLCSEITVNRHFQSNMNLVWLLILNVLPSEQTVASGPLHFHNGLKWNTRQISATILGTGQF